MLCNYINGDKVLTFRILIISSAFLLCHYDSRSDEPVTRKGKQKLDNRKLYFLSHNANAIKTVNRQS